MARRGWSTSNFLRCTSAPVTAVPLSMACWAKTSTGGTQAMIGLGNSASVALRDLFLLYVDTTSNQVGAFTGNTAGSSGIALTSTTVSASTWFHAGAVFTSATSRAAYLNGAGKGTNATNLTPSGANRTSVGAVDQATVIDPFAPAGTGDIAEAAIWNVALSDADMVSLAKGIHPFLVRPDGLVAYWPLIGAFSPEINLKSNSATMAIQGALSQSAHTRIFNPSHRRPQKFKTAVATGISYPRLERGIRGLGRGVAIGGY